MNNNKSCTRFFLCFSSYFSKWKTLACNCIFSRRVQNSKDFPLLFSHTLHLLKHPMTTQNILSPVQVSNLFKIQIESIIIIQAAVTKIHSYGCNILFFFRILNDPQITLAAMFEFSLLSRIGCIVCSRKWLWSLTQFSIWVKYHSGWKRKSRTKSTKKEEILITKEDL